MGVNEEKLSLTLLHILKTDRIWQGLRHSEVNFNHMLNKKDPLGFWCLLSHRTSHEPLLPQRDQSVEPQLLGLLLVHEQLQGRVERKCYYADRQSCNTTGLKETTKCLPLV